MPTQSSDGQNPMGKATAKTMRVEPRELRAAGGAVDVHVIDVHGGWIEFPKLIHHPAFMKLSLLHHNGIADIVAAVRRPDLEAV